ncbi:unnamed protein product [Mytilus coruscus]|uniref:PHD-type domain-containing protein n=1 Tax=Mytilus coruscus TaxID=42192 RepID=A0A6J8DDD7_MYTCO|nr:unnamed protein product [Mytilus coruscus]
MSQHMCITTALTTQIAMQLQQSLSLRSQVPPVTINMVPQPAPYIQGQPQICHQYPMYNHATQPAMQAQTRNNNQTRKTQHINTNVNTSSNILEKQQENTPHVLYTDNSTNVIAQDPTIICSDGQNKMVRKNNEKLNMYQTWHDNRNTQQSSQRLNIITCNIEGVKGNSAYLSDLSKEQDIICLQEHWLWSFELQKLDEKLTDYIKVFGRSHDCNEPITNYKIPRGRAGVAIVWPKKFDKVISKLDDGNERIIAIEIMSVPKPTCLINAYMPTNAAQSLDEYKREILETETPNLHGIKQYTPILLADSKGYQLYKQRNYNTVETEIQWWGDSGYTTPDGLQYIKRNINRAIGNFGNILIYIWLGTCDLAVKREIIKLIYGQHQILPLSISVRNFKKLVTSYQASQKLDNTNVTGHRIKQSSIEYTQISQTEDQQNVTIYFCPICNERAGERTVGCEQCDEWIHFNCAGLKDSDIDKITDNPFVCRLCIENNLYSTEIAHNNTSVNNTVNDVLHLDQQEPAIEFPKDKDQSTLPPEDEMKRIQQNIQIVETNSSIVITEETQSNDQNMLITSNSVQAVA